MLISVMQHAYVHSIQYETLYSKSYGILLSSHHECSLENCNPTKYLHREISYTKLEIA